MPGTFTQRYLLAITKYLPRALYGCETAPLSLQALTKLESALSLLLLGRQAERERCSRTTALVFAACAPHAGAVACPRFYIFHRRLMGVRRWLAKGTVQQKDSAHALLSRYAAEARGGTYLPEEGLFLPWQRRLPVKHWRWAQRPAGPVALLLQTCLEMGAAILPGWILVSHYAPPVHLTRDPIQWMRQAAYHIWEGAIFHTIGAHRKDLIGIRAGYAGEPRPGDRHD